VRVIQMPRKGDGDSPDSKVKSIDGSRRIRRSAKNVTIQDLEIMLGRVVVILDEVVNRQEEHERILKLLMSKLTTSPSE
jgi:hypothetical protein